MIVEASTDMVNWLPIRINTFDGDLSFSDPQRGAEFGRFYRANTPQTKANESEMRNINP